MKQNRLHQNNLEQLVRNIKFDEFMWIWNSCQNLRTPSLHVEMARWLEDNTKEHNPRLLLLAFRNSGKSTLTGLFAAWFLLIRPNTRILSLAADFALAKKMVRNVKRVVERHPLTRHLKPPRTDQWASDQFTIRRSVELRDPSMLAKGIGANITGLRADLVICDDVEVPNTCDTPQKREELRNRLQEIEYVLVPGGSQVFIGTPHTHDSIYVSKEVHDLKGNPPFLSGFSRLEIPLLDGRGNSRWPERFPKDRIESIQIASGPNKFQSQMLLRPVDIVDGRLDSDAINIYDKSMIYTEGNRESRLHIDNHRMVSASSWWDPSFGAPEQGDASVVACVFTSENGDYWLHDIEYISHDPSITDEIDEASQMCRTVAAFIDRNRVPALTLEVNGLGRFLPGLLRRELHSNETRCAVIEHTSKRNKDVRILEGFDAVLAARRLHVHKNVLATPFIREMREWRPASRCADDGLDAVAGCLLNEPVRLPSRQISEPVRRARPWTAIGRTHTADHGFEI